MRYFLCLCLFFTIGLTSCKKSDDSPILIAILTPITHPSLEEIEKGFIETMKNKNPGKYRFVTYNGQGNKMLMRSEIEEIAKNDYALLFTIGTSASLMSTEVFEKKNLSTPIVFTCVNDPVGFRIVSKERDPGGSVTGVKELLRFDDELASLLQYKPTIQRVLLVYNPREPGLQKDQQQVEDILNKHRIDLQTVEVFQTNELLAKVSPFISSADALVVLKDNTVVSGLEVLVKLCNSHQIPLMASDLDSPDRGAAFGYGVHEIQFGIEGAQKALQILDQGIHPGSISVTPVSEFSLRINSEAAKKQGIHL